MNVEFECGNASRKGVPLPRGWKGKLAWRSGTPAVDEYAATAVQRARAELGLRDVKLDCRPSFKKKTYTRTLVRIRPCELRAGMLATAVPR